MAGSKHRSAFEREGALRRGPVDERQEGRPGGGHLGDGKVDGRWEGPKITFYIISLMRSKHLHAKPPRERRSVQASEAGST